MGSSRLWHVRGFVCVPSREWRPAPSALRPRPQRLPGAAKRSGHRNTSAWVTVRAWSLRWRISELWEGCSGSPRSPPVLQGIELASACSFLLRLILAFTWLHILPGSHSHMCARRSAGASQAFARTRPCQKHPKLSSPGWSTSRYPETLINQLSETSSPDFQSPKPDPTSSTVL